MLCGDGAAGVWKGYAGRTCACKSDDELQGTSSTAPSQPSTLPCFPHQSPLFLSSLCSDASPSLLPPPRQGIAEVEAEFAGQDKVHFTDRLLFLVGRKPDAGSSTAAGAAGAAPSDGAEEEARQLPAAACQQVQQPPVLTVEQRRQYEEQGFTGPVDICSNEEAAQLAERYQQYQERLGRAVTGDWRFKSHLLLPWVWDLVHHPRLLAAVSEALGGCRNILCWSTDWFVKRPGDGGYTGWHQASHALWRRGGAKHK